MEARAYRRWKGEFAQKCANPLCVTALKSVKTPQPDPRTPG